MTSFTASAVFMVTQPGSWSVPLTGLVRFSETIRRSGSYSESTNPMPLMQNFPFETGSSGRPSSVMALSRPVAGSTPMTT